MAYAPKLLSPPRERLVWYQAAQLMKEPRVCGVPVVLSPVQLEATGSWLGR